MRLTELQPRWTGYGEGAVIDGISFLCPHCMRQRLAVKFNPPIDKDHWIARGIATPIYELMWHRTGETFDTLSLSPSINAGNNRMDFNNHWHGFICNGEISISDSDICKLQ